MDENTGKTLCMVICCLLICLGGLITGIVLYTEAVEYNKETTKEDCVISNVIETQCDYWCSCTGLNCNANRCESRCNLHGIHTESVCRNCILCCDQCSGAMFTYKVLTDKCSTSEISQKESDKDYLCTGSASDYRVNDTATCYVSNCGNDATFTFAKPSASLETPIILMSVFGGILALCCCGVFCFVVCAAGAGIKEAEEEANQGT
eukprot:795861_1